MEKLNPKIIFIGTPQFGAIILEGLCKSEYKPVFVVTAPDKPIGRKQILTPPPVKVFAQMYNIPVLQPTTIANSKEQIADSRPDLIILASFGQILPKEILEIPKYGCLNVHPSLLPKYRGPSPTQYAILNGEKETGVTIILIDSQMDHGPILAQNKTVIGQNETAKELHDRLAFLGTELLIDTIPDWVDNKINLKPQDEKQATYTKILKKEDGKIDWKKSAKEIEQKIRAFNLWPGSFTFFRKNDKLLRIKILKANILKQTNHGPFGSPGKTFLAPNDKIAVQTGKDFLIIEELQPESRKKMASKGFLKGHSDFIGTIFE